MTPDESRLIAAKRAAERAARRRRDEGLCALDFLTWGDDRHECIFAMEGKQPCSRTYYAGPPPEDVKLYEGTGIGALYDLQGTEHHKWQLAGWNIIITTGREIPYDDAKPGKK